MNTGELVALLRSEIVHFNHELVSDSEMIRYLDEAYKMFFRLNGGITDMDSIVTELDVEAGEYEVNLHPSILRINQAVRRSDGEAVQVRNYPEMINEDGVANLLRETGKVEMMLVGVKPHYARWVPIPSENDIVDLIVERLPLKNLTESNSSLSELDEIHHIPLLDWVKSRLFKRPGAGFFNLNLAASFEAQFREYCLQAAMEKSRFKSKVRTVTYGGI